MTPQAETTSPAQDTLSPAFRAALTDLLSLAIADHPEWAVKVSKAAHLVELGHVRPDRGGFTVESECTPGTAYWVDRTSCSCPDFQKRGRYCKHQLAVGLLRAVEKRLVGERNVRPQRAAAPIPYEVTADGLLYLQGCADGQNDRPATYHADCLNRAAYMAGYRDGQSARVEVA
jgi:hypothetical protein